MDQRSKRRKPLQDEEDRMGTVGTERRGKRKVGLVLASVVPFHSQLVLFHPLTL